MARDGLRPGATNRVVLLSDGLANVGDTAASPILSQVKENAAKQITLLGVGVGHQYGDQLMEQLADQGDGYVIYVSDLDDTRAAFREQLPATIPIRALDAKVQVSFDPQTVAAYRLIGYDDRALADSAFRDDRVDGGEVFAGHTVTALYTVRLQARRRRHRSPGAHPLARPRYAQRARDRRHRLRDRPERRLRGGGAPAAGLLQRRLLRREPTPQPVRQPDPVDRPRLDRRRRGPAHRRPVGVRPGSPHQPSR